MTWFKGEVCEGIYDALGETVEYDYANITSAPWYDSANPESARFFGVFIVDAGGEYDSTRSRGIVEGIGDGGVLGSSRKGPRELRMQAIVAAQGLDALEYGMAWLSRVLDPGTCGQHGTGCGMTDLGFFAECPPALSGDPEQWQELVESLYRFTHNTGVVSGPLVKAEHESHGFYVNEVEFTFTSEHPYVFKTTIPVNVPPSLPVVVQDIPYNLIPYPSAELASGTVVVATNLAVNPSAETNATGWGLYADNTNLPAANVTIATSTELEAVGAQSAKVLFTAVSAGASGKLGVNQTVTLTGIGPTTRYSVNMWAVGSVESGTAVLGSLNISVYWQNASSATLREDTAYTGPASGGPATLPSVLPPAGTTKVLVRAWMNVTSWSTGAKVRVYADALAVTVP